MPRTLDTHTRQARRALFRIYHKPRGRRVPAGVAARTVKALLAGRLVEAVGEWAPHFRYNGRGGKMWRHIQPTQSGERRASEVEATMGPWWNPAALRASKTPRAKPEPWEPRTVQRDNAGRDRENARRVGQMQARAVAT